MPQECISIRCNCGQNDNFVARISDRKGANSKPVLIRIFNQSVCKHEGCLLQNLCSLRVANGLTEAPTVIDLLSSSAH